MTPPRLEARWWGQIQWPRLSRALEYSARAHNPDWLINVQRIAVDLPHSPLGIPSHSANTAKMSAWRRIIETSHDGDRVLLIDADTMVLRPLSDVWDTAFDFAYTGKPHTARFPFNSGVVFVRVGPKTREFFRAWEAENVRLLESPREHQIWRARYGGVNQAALGAMLENKIVAQMEMVIAELPCREWNNEDSAWQEFATANPRVVHLKSGLRQCVFSGTVLRPEFQQIIDTWRAIDRAAADDEERAYNERSGTC